MSFAGLSFLSPWLLLGLLSLPLIWYLLRATPPAPRRLHFPAVTLLLGLKDQERVAAQTPLWLLILRLLALAALIIGFAGPIWNAAASSNTDRPVLFILEDDWSAAPNWPRVQAQLETRLQIMQQTAQPGAILSLTNPQPLEFAPARFLLRQVPGLEPSSWFSDFAAASVAVKESVSLQDGAEIDIIWIGAGKKAPGRAELINQIEALGKLSVLEPAPQLRALGPLRHDPNGVSLTVFTRAQAVSQTVILDAIGTDPAQNTVRLLQEEVVMAPGETSQTVTLRLRDEQIARLSAVKIAEYPSAAAVSLSNTHLVEPKIALIGQSDQNEAARLLSPLHYLRQALSDQARLLEGGLAQLLPAEPDMIILPDHIELSEALREELEGWIGEGGVLLRFAGPNLARSSSAGSAEDALLPVRIRAGGRVLGGAMSWDAPKALAPFDPEGPFAGLKPPKDVAVRAQILAQPSPELANRVLARLVDGTPLVTGHRVGAGRVVLFHIGADPVWSNLPLSSLFMDMMLRLAEGKAADPVTLEAQEAKNWLPVQVLDAFGQSLATKALGAVSGRDLARAPLGPTLLPGQYRADAQSYVRPVVTAPDVLEHGAWPASVRILRADDAQISPLGPWLLVLALIALGLDLLTILWLRGSIRLGKLGLQSIAILMLMSGIDLQPAKAQSAFLAANDEPPLAYIETGAARIDTVSEAGLNGLSLVLSLRSSVEPAPAMGIDLESDTIAQYPLIYWPIHPDQPNPSDAAYAKLNDYLRHGGLILFDTRDADIAAMGRLTPETRALRRLAAPLNLPLLATVPRDHVLTRSFYLLHDFPGRYRNGEIWAEAPNLEAAQIEGMPFRQLNDGVTPVVIGGNDWASAWAVDAQGAPLVSLGSGLGAERQRELAYRFGVNLVMYALAGNYKSDQVHVPELLERLGQ